MNKPEKQIFWHQGLFLQPHHFQQNDVFFKSLLTPYNYYQTPYFWGCGHIHIQETSLGGRLLEIDSCELIFQDGTWVKCPENAVIRPRSFEDLSFDVEKDSPVTVYLGIKKYNPYGKNVTSLDSADSTESVATRSIAYVEPESVKETHAGGDPAAIRKIDHFVKIFWDHEVDTYRDYLMIPVCCLELKDDAVGLSRSYVPPTYLISGSDIVMSILKNLRENIISRCRVFESFKFSQGFTSDFDAHFLPHLLVLSALNRSLPVINHIIEVETIHPHAAYCALRQMVGDLSTFTDRINALGQLKDGMPLLPEYDHETLYKCFDDAQTLLGELLRGVSIGGESIFTMAREDARFTVKIPAEEFKDSYMYFLVLKTGEDQERIINEIHNLAKMAPPGQIENMISRALPGVPLKHRLVPPPGMPKRAGSFYFRIDSKNHLWSEIKQWGDICLFWDNAPEDVSIEIVISQI